MWQVAFRRIIINVLKQYTEGQILWIYEIKKTVTREAKVTRALMRTKRLFFFGLIFPCGVFPCPSLSWHGMVIHFARELLAPSWCCALFRLSFLVHMFGGSCTGRICHLSCGIHAVYMLPILSEHGLWLDGKWFCLFDIRFVDDFWHGLNYNVVSCTITILYQDNDRYEKHNTLKYKKAKTINASPYFFNNTM